MAQRVDAFRQLKSRISLYKELSKSGIVTLVLISVLGGYLLGLPFDRPLDALHLFHTLLAILFLASGSGALNQYQDREMDAKMSRTAKRPIPGGRLSANEALLFSCALIALGLMGLFALSVELVLLGLAALFFYNVCYTLWWKRHWSFAAVPGAIPGALPISMGYIAASGLLWSPGAWYLFAILFVWQMPHFWSLALRYREDYRAGAVPTLPVSHGSAATVNHIVLWCLAYVGIASVGPLFLQVGWIYVGISILVSLLLIWELRGFTKAPESKRWLRFFLWTNFSLILYLTAAVIDRWGIYLLVPLTR